MRIEKCIEASRNNSDKAIFFNKIHLFVPLIWFWTSCPSDFGNEGELQHINSHFLEKYCRMH